MKFSFEVPLDKTYMNVVNDCISDPQEYFQNIFEEVMIEEIRQIEFNQNNPDHWDPQGDE